MTVKVATGRESIVRAGSSTTPAMRPSKIATNQGGKATRDVPLFIPADQTYYWSGVWQLDVLESLMALREGEFEDFDSNDPTDAARWLLSVDEDDCD